MITKIINEFKQFKGKNKIIFTLSVLNHLPIFIRDKSFLTMDFVAPMKIKDYRGTNVTVNSYPEFAFHTYDYSNIIKKTKDNTLFLDIGAHFGEVSHRFLTERDGYAYMFEINPNNCKIIRKLMKQHKTRSTLLNFGLGEIDCTDTLVLSNPLSYEGSLKSTEGKLRIRNVKVRKLKTKMLDRYDRYNNIFISLDVEGYEYQVLQGMASFLEEVNNDNKKISLFIEIKDKDNLREIANFLRYKIQGLTVKKITKEDYLFSN